jgi:hypothetical protein
VAATRAGNVAGAVRVNFDPKPDTTCADDVGAEKIRGIVAVRGQLNLSQWLVSVPVR